MKIVYIASEFGISNGTNTNMMVHYRTLIRIFGRENVITVDLNSGGKQIETTHSISYLKPTNLKEKFKRGIQGHTSLMSNAIIGDIVALIKEHHVEILFVDESLFGIMVKKIKKRFPQLQIATFYHDVKRNLYLQWIKKDGFGAAIKRYIPGLYNERINAKYADINITLNRRESEMLQHYYGIDERLELPVGIPYPPHDEGKRIYMDEKCFHLLFVGAKYYANVVGIRWFCNEVIPQTNQQIHLWIVGKGMEDYREELGTNRVHVVGTADSLAEYYRSADVVIAPIFDGAGMKVKTAEALSYGKCFIGTKESAVGYLEYCPECCREYFFECNDAENFVVTIEKLRKRGVRKENSEILKFFKSEYSLDAIECKLRSILKVGKENDNH